MPNTPLQRDLISHCIQFMSNKDVIKTLFDEKGIRYRVNSTYIELAQAYASQPDALSIDDIRTLFRGKWSPCDIEGHYSILKSGALNSHSWCGTRPSMLHLSIQDLVRKCTAGSISLEKFLSRGSEILKHEYFMVAVHDICETSIIKQFPSVIPPIGYRSITDYIFNDTPYDLKVTTHLEEWKPLAGRMTVEDKKGLALAFFKKADSERKRRMSKGCKNNWGLTRMFYVVGDQNKWLDDPRGMVSYLIDNLSDANNYFDIVIQDRTIHICLIEQ